MAELKWYFHSDDEALRQVARKWLGRWSDNGSYSFVEDEEDPDVLLVDEAMIDDGKIIFDEIMYDGVEEVYDSDPLVLLLEGDYLAPNDFPCEERIYKTGSMFEVLERKMEKMAGESV